MNDPMKLAAKWTNDCQGKKDYDGSIVRISTRYWPRGGGVSISTGGDFVTNGDKTIRPSATATIVLCHGEPREGSPEGDYLDLAEQDFEGETYEEVSAAVEAWGQAQFDRTLSLLMGKIRVFDRWTAYGFR